MEEKPKPRTIPLHKRLEMRLHKRARTRAALLNLGIMVVVATPFVLIEYNYQKQAQEIHRAFTTIQRQENGITNRLSVYEELSALRTQGYTQNYLAVDFLRKAGVDYYLTPEGFERKN